ncbi:MAG: hypothetical protein ACOC57_06810, partial [Acidobacteriota bacterium]
EGYGIRHPLDSLVRNLAPVRASLSSPSERNHARSALTGDSLSHTLPLLINTNSIPELEMLPLTFYGQGQ